MKTLLLFPCTLKTDVAAAVAADRHPLLEHSALAETLRTAHHADAVLLDYSTMERSRHLLVYFARKIGGRDCGLAVLGWLHCQRYDTVFTAGENVALPLALLLKLSRRRPGHVTIGHRLSADKKRLFYTWLGAHRQMDTIFVYAAAQRDFAIRRLGISAHQLRLIPLYADSRFFRPRPADIVRETQICSAGREWRDDPTLTQAVSSLPGLSIKLTASSWSKHREDGTLSSGQGTCRSEYGALRDHYAQSSFVVVSLLENDYQAGMTTILEAMAMGKAVIATRTVGQADVIVDGETGLTVAPGDVEGWRMAIRMLLSDPVQRERLGRNGRRWLEENATLGRWAERIATAICQAASMPQQQTLKANPITDQL